MSDEAEDLRAGLALLAACQNGPVWQSHYPEAAPELGAFLREIEEALVRNWIHLAAVMRDDPATLFTREGIERWLGVAQPGGLHPEVNVVARLQLTFKIAASPPREATALQGRPDLPDLPDRLTRAEVLNAWLPLVWADCELWKLIRDAGSQPTLLPQIDLHLLRTYQIRFGFPSVMWDQLVRFPQHRRYLFDLIPSLPKRFCGLPPALGPTPGSEMQGAVREASEALSTLLAEESGDPLPALARAALPATSLKAIQAACDRLRADAAWCLAHPGMVPAPQSSVPRPSPSRLRRVEVLERMVEALRSEPGLSDYSLAKQVLGDPGSTGRTQAAEARRLASLRERIPVVHYETRGRRRGRGPG